MFDLDRLDAADVRNLVGVAFDLDDTVLDHGRLTPAALNGIDALSRAGYRLVACTGRPASWAELFFRLLPLDIAIAENGAVFFVADEHGRPRLVDPVPAALRAERHERLESLTGELLGAFSQAQLADDNAGRITDVTFDIGETRTVEKDVVDAMDAFARERGVSTFRSSVHFHITLDREDKATGLVRALASSQTDATALRYRWAYVGDSANDAPAFAGFHVTCGVQNVAPIARRLSVPPRFITRRARGAGFAELAERLIKLSPQRLAGG